MLQQPERPHRLSLTKRRLTIRAANHPPPPIAPDDPLLDGNGNPLASEPEAEADDEADESESDEDVITDLEKDRLSEDSTSSSSDTSDDEEDEEKLKTRAFERKRRKTTMRPFIDSVFGGKLASVVICDECKHGKPGRRAGLVLS